MSFLSEKMAENEYIWKFYCFECWKFYEDLSTWNLLYQFYMTFK